MSIEDKLKNLILERYGNMIVFSKEIGMANSTLSTIMVRGIHNSSVNNIIKICRALDISVDELAADRIVPNGKVLQAKQPMTDIEDIISFTKMNIATYSDLTLAGKQLSDDDKESLMDAIDLCIEFIKRRIERSKNKE